MRPSSVLITAAIAACLAVALPAQGLAAGSLSVSPAIVEHVATKGRVGTITIANSTSAALKITVTPRPWLQSRATGVVSPDRKRTLSSSVTTSPRTFTLAAGTNRAVGLSLRHTPSARSLYGALEVVGLPTKKPKNGVIAGYRLVSSLRFNPPSSKRRLTAQVGAPRVAGSGSARGILVGVRNNGNTIDPITGSATITGARGTRRVTIAARRILPGGIVDVRLSSTAGLARGTYTVRTTINQAGKTIAHGKGNIRI